MNTTKKAALAERAIRTMLRMVNLPARVYSQACNILLQLSAGILDGASEFLRSQLPRCSALAPLAAVVSLTADLVD